MTIFEDRIYEQIRRGTQRSAAQLAPAIVDELSHPARGVKPPTGPYEVLDVGCGEGWWSAALAADPRVGEVISIDQQPPDVVAPGVNVQTLDLERGHDVHRVGDAFDLTLCLEVAEHLPAPAGDRLIGMLCHVTAPNGRIVFSAAVPGQGGHGHVNEQWPSYWDERFRRHGWMLIDLWRDQWWDAEEVEPWYRQNLLCAVAPAANGTAWALGSSPRSLVHPDIWSWRLNDVVFWREDALKWKALAEKWEAAHEGTMG